MSSAEQLRTKAEAARYLRISAPSLDRLRAAGEIQAVKVGVLVRFRDSDIQNYVARNVETSSRRNASGATT